MRWCYRRRLIPTCVGSTAAVYVSGNQNAAHPHVCGEHAFPPRIAVGFSGSSPRVWGAPTTRRPGRNHPRLIPTCVGSTRCEIRGGLGSAAHPHVCGEHAVRRTFLSRHFGSSPRVWGARCLMRRRSAPSRLIPTCVGSTDRGLLFEAATQGSSPRVWGARLSRRRVPTV